jgi:BlaI family penicillinase repressor
MQRLSPSEERVANILWQWPGGASVSGIIGGLPTPLPPYTTLASTLQQLVSKGYARVEKRGRHKWFIPLLSGAEYASAWLARFVAVHFAGSYAELVRFCVRQGQLSQQELCEVLYQLSAH